jgi:hypothetical protein
MIEARSCGAGGFAMTGWDAFKQGFDTWERATAKLFDVWLESPMVLEPAGAMLTSFMRAKALGDRALELWWKSVGLPTRRDQERALFMIQELESKLLDLEEKLEERP